MMKSRLGIVLAVVLLPMTSSGHHSVAANFDVSRTIELDGEVTRITWRNPHVGLTLRTVDGGREAFWELESHSLSVLKRMDITEPFFEVGDLVRVAGFPARHLANAMFVTHMLLPSGEEFVFQFGADPAELRWSDRLWGTTERWFAEAGDTSEAQRGIFRVWSTSLAGGRGFFWRNTSPLTDSARAALQAWDPVGDDPLADCAPKGMPTMMS